MFNALQKGDLSLKITSRLNSRPKAINSNDVRAKVNSTLAKYEK